MPVIGSTAPSLPVPETAPTPAKAPVILGIFGDVERTGRWTPAPLTKIIPIFGDVRLDLREADLSSGQVEIRGYVAFGDVTIIVPPDVDVDLQAFTIFGDHKHQQIAPATPGQRRVVVTVYGVFCDITVKTLAVGQQEPRWWKRRGS